MTAEDDDVRESGVIGCSVRGQKNVDNDVPCQDDNEKRTLQDNKYIIAAADGLGSADLSHVGSNIATQAAVNHLENELSDSGSLDKETLQSAFLKAFAHARKQLHQEADSTGVPVSALNTTLLVAVGGPAGVGGAAVGDGGIVCHRGGQTGLVIPREDTEYENKTIPIQSENWEESYRSGWVADADAAAVFSDGLDGVAWDGPASVSDSFFDQVFNNVRDYSNLDELEEFLQEFLDSESLRKSSRDDKTLVVGTLPTSEWTDPTEVGSLDTPFVEPSTTATADTGQPSGKQAESVTLQQTKHKSRDRDAGQATVGKQYSDHGIRRIASVAGIVVLVVVVAVAAMSFGLISEENGNDESNSLRNNGVGDPGQEPTPSSEDEAKNSEQETSSSSEDESRSIEVKNPPLETPDFEKRKAERGDTVSVTVEVTSPLLEDDSDEEVSEGTIEYFLKNETGGKEKIDSHELPAATEKVTLEGDINHSSTALDSKSVNQIIRVTGNTLDEDINRTESLNLSNSIQAAVNFADEEETVEVYPGTYDESIHISVGNVTIEPATEGDVTVRAEGDAALRTSADNVTVTGVELVSATDEDVISHTNTGNLSIINSTLKINDDSESGLAIDTQDGGGPIEVLNSTIVGIDATDSPVRGINVYNPTSDGTVIDNVTFRDNLSRGIQINASTVDGPDNVLITDSNFTDGISEIAVDVGGTSNRTFEDIVVSHNEFGDVGTALRYSPLKHSDNLEFQYNNLAVGEGFRENEVVTNNAPENATVNAMQVWWGNEAGPSGEIEGPNGEMADGEGATVSEGVAFDPWREAPFPDGELAGEIELNITDPQEDVQVTVQLLEGSTNTEVETTTIEINGSDTNSSYKFDKVARGEYIVQADAENYMEKTEEIRVGVGENAEQNLPLKRKTGSVTGVVKAENEIIKNATILVWTFADQNTGKIDFRFENETDDDGRFVLSDDTLPVGDHFIQVQHQKVTAKMTVTIDEDGSDLGEIILRPKDGEIPNGENNKILFSGLKVADEAYTEERTETRSDKNQKGGVVMKPTEQYTQFELNSENRVTEADPGGKSHE